MRVHFGFQSVGARSAAPPGDALKSIRPGDRMRGGRWVPALPTGGSAQTSVGVWGSVKRMRNLPQLTPRRAVPARQSAGKPADSQTLAAPIYGGQWSSKEPAAAGGCRLSLPGNPENSGSSIYASRIRRQNRRQQVAVGPADRRQQVGVGSADRRQRANFDGGLGEREANAEPPPASPEAGSARPAIRREACGFADIGRSNLWRPMVVERTGGSRWVQAQPARKSGEFGKFNLCFPNSSPEPAAASGTGHCPADRLLTGRRF